MLFLHFKEKMCNNSAMMEPEIIRVLLGRGPDVVTLELSEVAGLILAHLHPCHDLEP